ncbi:Hsp20 family protein [Biformimicrobium ophioploci]|uniref:Hsp20 family protein n=1 Tax=Biformimicrobium ophioploci TaxID=3036711 RepID=A0ABQ6M330_9GAMM|nr:Hsp20 family protein [Microbulbifer sp. NKW57]GMG88672.1 Hsp20 family protein [Microbulbifer sp. NKW57]
MRNLDFSPLYRSAIGFDRMANLLDSMMTTEQNQPSYPPYNIELTGENNYRISMAVAGFSQDELDIQMDQNKLTVTANRSDEKVEKNFLHRGIAARNFERRFQLADHVKVVDAKLEHGLLHIDLVREIPEAMKPRKIQINGGSLIESGTEKEQETAETQTRVA